MWPRGKTFDICGHGLSPNILRIGKKKVHSVSQQPTKLVDIRRHKLCHICLFPSGDNYADIGHCRICFYLPLIQYCFASQKKITQSLSYSDISRDVGSWSSNRPLEDFAMSSYFKGVDCTLGTCLFAEFQQRMQGKEQNLHQCGQVWCFTVRVTTAFFFKALLQFLL